MKVGLLWFDDDPKHTLTEKITRAAKRHREKYGAPPNLCYVHPSALGGNGKTAQRPLRAPPRVLHCESTTASPRGGTLVAGAVVRAAGGTVRVATLPTVLPHHLWIGQEDQP